MPEMPTWEDFIAPVLVVLSDGSTRSLREVRSLVAAHVGLTDEQRADVLPSGQGRADNRIGWAASYLNRVDALRRPNRGHYAIQPLGRTLLAQHPHGVKEADLRLLAKEGDSWWRSESPAVEVPSTPKQAMLDPLEQVEQGVARIHEAVAEELLERLRDKEPAFFERAVVELLVKMGYGGTGGVAAATQLVNDGGIDGIIDQDVLGLSKVYIQAKRYAAGNSVGRPELQGFVGALIGKADRGVFITTSTFSNGAIEYADRNTTMRLILIDGTRLTDLMIRYGVGVQIKNTFHVVEVDEDFFE